MCLHGELFIWIPLLTLCILGNFACFLSSVDFFFKNFFKNSFRNTIRVSNSLDSDQTHRFVRPDLDPNSLQRLSADDKKSFRNTFRVSNNLDPDQARRFVGPDLLPNCLQRLSSVDKKIFQEYHQRVKQLGSRSGPDLGPNCLARLSADDKNVNNSGEKVI